MVTWDVVENDPSYQGMTPANKEKTKRLYLSRVIAKDPSYVAMSDAHKKEVISL